MADGLPGKGEAAREMVTIFCNRSLYEIIQWLPSQEHISKKKTIPKPQICFKGICLSSTMETNLFYANLLLERGLKICVGQRVHL